MGALKVNRGLSPRARGYDECDGPPPVAGTPLSTDLPERLRLATRELHAAAERSGLMAALLAGRLGRPGYCALLRNLHAIYTALEAALSALGDDAAVSMIDLAALRRGPALASDLLSLHGPLWHDELPLQPAAADHAARLRALAAAGSRAVVAHAYVRYLGDLHGGQVLRRRVAVALHLAPAQAAAATRFYEFGSEKQVLAHRHALRAALAAMPLSPDERDQVVAEARWAFEQHGRLFAALQPA